MKVILRQDIEKLGGMGDIVKVKNGYARNYLIPRGFAYFATDSSIKTLEYEKKQHNKKIALEKESAGELASQLSELQISIAMKVGEEGKLYGSVTPQMVAEEMSLRGFEIDRKNIVIDEPIKSLGVFDLKVKLHSEVTAILKIWVIEE